MGPRPGARGEGASLVLGFLFRSRTGSKSRSKAEEVLSLRADVTVLLSFVFVLLVRYWCVVLAQNP